MDGTESDALVSGWRAKALVPTLILVGLVVAVMGSLGAPLLPTIAHDDGVSLSRVQWLLTIALLSGALATPIMGRLGDGRRRREVILSSLAVVLLGSVLAAVSHGFTLLVVARAMQGVGFGLMPVTMTVARVHLPKYRADSAIAALSITTATGVGLGYPISGLLAERFDYHASFWFGAIVATIAIACATAVVPKSASGPHRSLDVFGALVFSVALVVLLVALGEGEAWRWSSARTLSSFGIVAVVAVIWVRHELRTPEPLVDLRLVRHPAVLTADLIGLMMSIALYLFLPVVVEFVQIAPRFGYGDGASVLVAGFVLLPLSVGTFVSSRLARSFSFRYGSSLAVGFGCLICAVAMIGFELFHADLWEAFVSSGLGGIGIGFAYAALPALVIAAVPTSETGSAMGFYQVLRTVGLSLGSAFCGSLLAAHTVGGSSIPSVWGYRDALIVGACVCALAIAVCLFGPARDRSAGRALGARTRTVPRRPATPDSASSPATGGARSWRFSVHTSETVRPPSGNTTSVPFVC